MKCSAASCRRKGFGDPPYCDLHAPGEESPYDEALETLLENPKVQEVVIKASSILDKIGSFVDDVKKGKLPKLQREVPAPAKPAGPSPRAVLHFGPTEVLTEEKIKKRRQALAKLAHPDAGGSDQAMAMVNRAADILLKGLKK